MKSENKTTLNQKTIFYVLLIMFLVCTFLMWSHPESFVLPAEMEVKLNIIVCFYSVLTMGSVRFSVVTPDEVGLSIST